MSPKYQSRAILLLAVSVVLVACRQDMHDQNKLEPFERETLFADERGSREPVDGTVARGQLNSDIHLHEGRRLIDDRASEQVDKFPYEVKLPMLERGQQRFDIFCAACHARTGNGDGMAVRRGLQKPPSFHSKKLREAKVGHLYDVVRRGLGAMPGYAAQISVHDRWAIVAYVRALQLTRNATIDDVPMAERRRLSRGGSQ
jgi:cytochrome c553